MIKPTPTTPYDAQVEALSDKAMLRGLTPLQVHELDILHAQQEAYLLGWEDREAQLHADIMNGDIEFFPPNPTGRTA